MRMRLTRSGNARVPDNFMCVVASLPQWQTQNTKHKTLCSLYILWVVRSETQEMHCTEQKFTTAASAATQCYILLLFQLLSTTKFPTLGVGICCTTSKVRRFLAGFTVGIKLLSSLSFSRSRSPSLSFSYVSVSHRLLAWWIMILRPSNATVLSLQEIN